ncbi:uncharacterized protein LOC114311997 [Camellia sinensis]|uniref:uncharacterized protein LOC114311997 n=1 Tax=Camellia sinensis TaxID=4442 RepID=UPI0010360BFE|nr:uncharacterized protein LOC114311997 [Camellia sinensis]
MNKKFKSGSSSNTGSSQSGNSMPTCTTCGKKHGDVCYRATGACYHCGKFGRVAKDHMGHFDVVLGMDWLAKYYATIDCALQRVIFRPPGQDEFYFEGKRVVSPLYLILVMKARKLINKGCQRYLCSVIIEPTIDITLDNIPVLRDFPDVFPDELPSQLVDREIEFTIDVIPGTQPISKTPYHMSTTKMKELKTQLQELLGKGFIHPSTSP